MFRYLFFGICIIVLGLVLVRFLHLGRMSARDSVNRHRVVKTLASPTPTTQLANPASQNCTAKGGQLKMMTRGDGGEYGLCYFEDDMACEEWALFRGECPVGGVKTTGFDTTDQMYCAWVGGQTLAVPNAQCTLPDGTTCSTVALYDGKCS